MMSDDRPEAVLRSFTCNYQGFTVVDKRYNYPVVMPWLLAELRPYDTCQLIRLLLTNRCLKGIDEASGKEVFTHDLPQVKRFIKSKSFTGMMAYIFEHDQGHTDFQLHGFVMKDPQMISDLYEGVRANSANSSPALVRGISVSNGVASPENSIAAFGNIDDLLNRGHQLFEVLYLGRVRLLGKSVENFDAIIAGVYAKLHATGHAGSSRFRLDSDRSHGSLDTDNHSGDAAEDHEQLTRRRRTSSACSVGGASSESNRSALLDISPANIRLFNLEHRCVLWEKAVRDLPCILSSYSRPDHLGLIAEADSEDQPCITEQFRYTLFIVQCANKEIASNAFATLKQTFLNCQNARRLCDLCPVNLFNKLCERLVDCSPEEVNSILTEHVLTMDPRDTDCVERWMRSCTAETLERKNQLFVAFLRGLLNSRQLLHSHERSTSSASSDDSLRKSSDLLTRAKNSFLSSFKSLSTKRQSFSETSPQPKSPGDIRRPRASTTLGLERPRKASFDENGRVANSAPESVGSPDVGSPQSSHDGSHFDFGPSRPRSATLDAKQPTEMSRVRHRSGEEFREAATHEWRSRRRSNSGDITDSGSDPPMPARRQSIRMKIFSSVVTTRHLDVPPVTEEEDEDEEEEEEEDDEGAEATEEDPSLSSSSPLRRARMRKKKRSKDHCRALWRKAILEIRMLIRMEKQNAASWGTRGDLSERLLCNDCAYEDISNPPSATVAQRWNQLLDAEERADLSLEDLHKAIRSGVPRGRRADAWRLLMRLSRKGKGSAKEDEEDYEELTRRLTTHQHAIIIDVGRTYPSHPFFSDPERGGQLCLFNILKAFSLLDPGVGYCQGLSFLVGMLLIHLPEREAYEALKYIMFDLGYRTIFTPDMDHMQLCLYQLSRLIHDHLPDLHRHFEEYNISPSFYATPWFLSIFATHYSLGFVARAFDLLFCFGTETIFKIGLVLLQENANLLLACSNFESICEALRSVLPTMSGIHVQKVFDQAFVVDITEDLKTYQIEFRVLREDLSIERASEPDRRLQELARELARRKRDMTTRCEAAERAITAQSERMAALQRDLEKALGSKRALQRESERLRDLVGRLRELLLTACPEPGEVLGEKLALEIAAALS